MGKSQLHLSIDSKIIEGIENLGINISAEVEEYLKNRLEYFAKNIYDENTKENLIKQMTNANLNILAIKNKLDILNKNEDQNKINQFIKESGLSEEEVKQMLKEGKIDLNRIKNE